MVNIGLIGRIIERRTGTEAVQPALPGTVIPARFARDPEHFAVHRPGPSPRLDPSAPLGAIWTELMASIGSERPDERPDGAHRRAEALLRRVKLGRCLDTLPERLALARSGAMGHAEFLELVLADEVDRRERSSAALRARAAGLDPHHDSRGWDDSSKVSFDQAIWRELTSLRFVESGHNALILGPVGVGKTFLATALGHAAVRRRFTVHFERCDRGGVSIAV